MDYETRNLLHNVCRFTYGDSGVSIPDGVRFGQGTGLSETRTIAILRELEASDFIAFDMDRRTTLTAKGMRWYPSNRHFSPRIPVHKRIVAGSQRWRRAKTRYWRLAIPSTRPQRYYRRTARLNLRLPNCPSAWYQWGRWTCDTQTVADWLNFITRFWVRRHGYSPRYVRPLVGYIVEEYCEYVMSIGKLAETVGSGP